jgi:hypothetical protein
MKNFTDFPHLSGHSSDDSLLRIYDYLESDRVGGGLDLRIPESAPDLIGEYFPDFKEVLTPYFSFAHGSIISAWNESKSADIAQCPVVWIDGNGDPYAVIGKNFADLLSLLHIYPGTIYDVLNATIRHIEMPDRFEDPRALFSEKIIIEKSQKKWEENRGFFTFHQWLESELKVPFNPGVASIIFEAYSSVKRFEPF